MGESQILPITASADGRLNMYFSQCRVTSQVVNYAACLWRQEVLSNPKTKVPADWNQCGEAAKCGRCMTVEMRREEVLQGRAIYFRGRTTDKTIKQEAMEINPPGYWKSADSAGQAPRETRVATPEPRVTASKPVKPVAAATIFDVMTGGADYAAALNAMTSAAPAPITPSTPAPVPTPVKPQVTTLPHIGPPAPVLAAPHIGPPAAIKPLGTTTPTALPGESPLAMARRLAAQRKSATT